MSHPTVVNDKETVVVYYVHSMSEYKADKIQRFVQKLGFSEVEARIYITLVKCGRLSLLELSRKTGVERTYLYRLVPGLVERGLLVEAVAQKAKVVEAARPEQIERMVSEQVSLSEELTREYAEFEKQVSNSPALPETAVRYYRGVAGIKQILWNELKAKGEILSYTYRNLEEPVGIPFFTKWVEQIERKKIISRDIRGDTFIKSTREPSHKHIHIGGSEWRYLPDTQLALTHNLDIYNNTVAIYYWHEGELVGVEIENKYVAETQRGIWRNMWELAKVI